MSLKCIDLYETDERLLFRSESAIFQIPDPERFIEKAENIINFYLDFNWEFEIVRGKYINKPSQCPHCRASINRPEEKKTDVNLSVRMMGDCFKDRTDIVVLVSADTDLIPPIDFILNNFPNKKVKVFFPPTNHSFDISSFMMAHKVKVIRLESNACRFANAVMPDTVTAGEKSYTIPDNWK